MKAYAPQLHPAADLGTSVPHRGVELPAAVAIAWSLAGGMLFGGAAVVLMLSIGKLSGHLMLTASATLFAVGAVVGLAHGVALGILGRPEGASIRDTVNALVHGLLYLVPAQLLGWLVAGWVAAMPLALSGHKVIGTALSGLAWVAMVVTTYFAASTGLHATKLAYRRWTHRVAGTALVGVVFASLVVAFLIQPPAIWFTSIRLSTPGAMILAFVSALGMVAAYAVVRVVIPAIVFGYLFWRRGLGTAVGAHLTAGAALGVLAL